MSEEPLTYKTNLPWVSAGGPSVPVDPVKTIEVKEGMIREMFLRMRDHPDQKRAVVVTDERLRKAACRRVTSMAKDGWNAHVDPWGHGPDWYVKAEGYVLPAYYWSDKEGDKSNHIESLSYGGGAASSDESELDAMWKGLMEHEAHRVHMLGQVATFAAQTHVGICVVYAPNSNWRWYASIITAPPSLDGE